MPLKEWVAEFEGHSIRVTNTWLGGAKLYVDGECRDTNRGAFAISATRPLLSARLDTNNVNSGLVEVFFKALLTVKAKICVNGKQVAGDIIEG